MSKNQWIVQFYEPAVERWLPRSEHATEDEARDALNQQQLLHTRMSFRVVRRES